LGLLSCGEGDKKLPAEIVHNPVSADGSAKENMPVMTFAQTEHDFGRIIEGEKVVYRFKFTNTGKSELLISTVSTSCGCAVAEYPRNIVKPGEEGSLKVTFDSQGRKGTQHKVITILANTQPNKTQLRIKATVVTP